jgi:predicted DNA-binding transcriptional regulator AlpA
MQILSIAKAGEIIGSRSTVYRLEKNDPTFPKRRSIYGGKTGFLDTELDEWMQSRPVAQPQSKNSGSGRPRKSVSPTQI